MRLKVEPGGRLLDLQSQAERRMGRTGLFRRQWSFPRQCNDPQSFMLRRRISQVPDSITVLPCVFVVKVEIVFCSLLCASAKIKAMYSCACHGGRIRPITGTFSTTRIFLHEALSP